MPRNSRGRSKRGAQFETVDTRFVAAPTTVIAISMTPADATDLATTNSKLNTEINPQF